MTRVLVTGGSGFLGRPTVAALLAAGCEVHVAGRRAGSEPRVQHHPVDLLTADAGRLIAAVRPEIVLHLAWTVEHGRFWTAPDNLDWVSATLRLARAATAAGVRRFVGAGTCAEYDWSFDQGRPRRETDPLASTHLYGEAKIATFRLLAHSFADAGLAFAWARIFHLFGPGEPAEKLVSTVLRTALTGGEMEVRSGPLVRDFMAAEDAGIALAALATSPVTGAVNVASGQPVSVRDLVLSVRSRAGHFRFHDDPPGAEPPVMTADVQRLRHEVGVPPPPPLTDRLRGMQEALAGASRLSGR